MKALLALTTIIILGQSAFAQMTNTARASFLIRAPGASATEYSLALRNSNMVSYVEWLQHRQARETAGTVQLDEALQLMDQDPLLAYDKLNVAAKSLQSKIMNANTLELLTSILIKMSELSVPERLKQSALERALDLISAHNTLLEISSFKRFAQEHQTALARNQKPNSLDLRIVRLFSEKIKMIQGYEGANLLIDGEAQEFDKINPPRGEHQWVLLTNTFEPLIFTGPWDQAAIFLTAPERKVPLSEGNCKSSRILSDNFEVQTQGRVFASLECFEKVKPEFHLDAIGNSLEQTSKLKQDDSQTRDRWIAAGLTLFAGGAFALKNKSISLKMPSFR